MKGSPARSIFMGQKKRPGWSAGRPNSTSDLDMGSRQRGSQSMMGVVPEHALHLVFQGELLLLEDGFFELFRLREEWSTSEVVDTFVEVVVLGGELAELVAAL